MTHGQLVRDEGVWPKCLPGKIPDLCGTDCPLRSSRGAEGLHAKQIFAFWPKQRQNVGVAVTNCKRTP